MCITRAMVGQILILMALRNPGRLWKESGDAELPALVARVLGVSADEIKKIMTGYSGQHGQAISMLQRVRILQDSSNGCDRA
jgi:hypothetical protein